MGALSSLEGTVRAPDKDICKRGKMVVRGGEDQDESARIKGGKLTSHVPPTVALGDLGAENDIWDASEPSGSTGEINDAFISLVVWVVPVVG